MARLRKLGERLLAKANRSKMSGWCFFAHAKVLNADPLARVSALLGILFAEMLRTIFNKGEIMFSETELGHWREVLLKLRDRLDADSAQIRAEATHASGGESAGGLSNLPIHLGDVGSQEAEVAVTVGMAENEAMLVGEVEDALTRIQERSFGMCEACRQPIPKPRLTALPYARYCVPCAEKYQPQESLPR